MRSVSVLVLLSSFALLVACGDDSGSSSSASNQSSSASGGAGGATASSTSTAGGENSSGGNGGAGNGGGSAGGAGSSVGGAGGAAPWQPTPGTTWQWQLSGPSLDLSYNVSVYDVDLFETSPAEMAQLKSDGRTVICYFSAGSWESYRPDSNDFPESVKGSSLDPPFTDELWVDIRSEALRTIMAKRLDEAVTRGCDAVEPDNVDGYTNNNGLGLTASDQLDYNLWIAGEAHNRGLSVGLKNDIDQLAQLEPAFDWALNEECWSYNECGAYQNTFIAAGKAVFHAEYVSSNQLSAVCGVTQPIGLSTLIKNIELDAYQLTCP